MAINKKFPNYTKHKPTPKVHATAQGPNRKQRRTTASYVRKLPYNRLVWEAKAEREQIAKGRRLRLQQRIAERRHKVDLAKRAQKAPALGITQVHLNRRRDRNAKDEK